MDFDVKTPKGLSDLNKHLTDRSYIEGFSPSSADVRYFSSLTSSDVKDKQHVARWWKHIHSFSDTERKNWREASSSSSSSAKETTNVEKKTETKEDDDDDFELFGTETPEQEAAREAEIQRIADETAKAKEAKRIAEGKEKPVQKSAVVLDVKVWEEGTDMKVLEDFVRSIKLEGLEWKASKLVKVAYGIFKLQISCHIVDEKVSMDEVQEMIQENEDLVQSTDVVSFTKL